MGEERVPSAGLELGDSLVRRGVERRPVVLLAAAASFVAVFFFCQLSGDASDGIALLYVVPVALTALELGLRAGLAAGALATALTALWAATGSPGFSVVGLATRALVFFAVGAIAGRFADRMRGAQGRQRSLLHSGVDLARLGQGDDLASVVAAHAAAVADARAVRVRLGEDEIVEPVAPGPRAARFAIGGEDAEDGVLEVELRSSGVVAAEERAALAALALQATVALQNRTLLARERERAALQAELRDARWLLDERARQLRSVLEGHERERREVAHELREEAAQVLAAVLLGLHLLERDLGSAGGGAQLAELREHIDATMGSLSELAVALRPPVLDGIGLGAALARLAESGRVEGLEGIAVDLAEDAEPLGSEVEAAVYRVVEDAVRAVAGPRQARVAARDGELRITVHPRDPAAETGDLTVLRARLALLGGSAEEAGGELVVRIPLPGERA